MVSNRLRSNSHWRTFIYCVGLLCLLTLGTPSPPGNAAPAPHTRATLTQAGLITLQDEDFLTTTSLIDPAQGFAYFSAGEGSAQHVIKVRLTDFKRVTSLYMPLSSGAIGSGVLDPVAGFAYFTTPTHVLRVRLSDFTLASTLPLNVTSNAPSFIVLDQPGGLAYIGLSPAVGVQKIIRLRLADFSLTGMLTLNSSGGSVTAGALDAPRGFVYFGTGNARLIRIRLSDFTYVDELALTDMEQLDRLVLDPLAGYAYAAGTTDARYRGAISKVRLADFTQVDTMFIFGNPGAPYFTTGPAALDTVSGTAYFSFSWGDDFIYTEDHFVVKINLADFSETARLHIHPSTIALDPSAGLGYLGRSTDIFQMRLADLTEVATLELERGETYLQAGVMDDINGYGYFMGWQKLIQVHLLDLVRTGGFWLNPGEYGTPAAVLDAPGGFAYFGIFTYGYPQPDLGAVVRVNLADFTRVDTLAFEPEMEATPTSAVLDPVRGVAYFGTANGQIVRVRLSDFTHAGSLTLPQTNGQGLSAAFIDATHEYAYFVSTRSSVALNVTRIRLTNFTQAGDLTLPISISSFGNTWTLNAVLDPRAGYAYITTPAQVLRVQLSDFTHTGTLDLPSTYGYTRAATLDATRGYLYLGTDSGTVLQISLADFTLSGSLPLTVGVPDQFSLPTVVHTPSIPALYFGTAYTNPGRIIQVRLDMEHVFYLPTTFDYFR